MKTALWILALCALAVPCFSEPVAQAPTREIVTTSPLAPMSVQRDGQTSLAVSAFVEIDPSSTLTATWQTEDGIQWTVTTPKKVGESVSNHAWRHRNAVKSLTNLVGGPAESTKPV